MPTPRPRHAEPRWRLLANFAGAGVVSAALATNAANRVLRSISRPRARGAVQKLDTWRTFATFSRPRPRGPLAEKKPADVRKTAGKRRDLW